MDKQTEPSTSKVTVQGVVMYLALLGAAGCAVALVVDVLHVGVPVWLILLAGTVLGSVVGGRLAYLRAAERELHRERRRTAAARETWRGGSADETEVDVPQSRY